MRPIISKPILAAVAAFAVIVATVQNAAAADKPPAHKPVQHETYSLFKVFGGPKPPTPAEKVRLLGEHLGRALDIALDLFSGNTAEFLSNNKAALLSGNSANLLSGNAPNLLSGNAPTCFPATRPTCFPATPNLLSGNAPKVLSGNTTPILSGNSFSMFSNFKLEIHIENSGNGAGGLPGVRPTAPQVTRPRASRPVEQPSSRTFQPPGLEPLPAPSNR